MKLQHTAEKTRNLLTTLPEHYQKLRIAISMALTLAMTTPETHAQAQPETIPLGHKNITEVFVTQELLDIFEITPEQFQEIVVDKDLEILNNILYYSYIIDDKEQDIFTLRNETVQVIDKQYLPSNKNNRESYKPEEMAKHLASRDDGVLDELMEEVACNESKTVILYWNFNELRGNGQIYYPRQDSIPISIVAINGDIRDTDHPAIPGRFERRSVLAHEMGHTFIDEEGTPMGLSHTWEKDRTRITKYSDRILEYLQDIYNWKKPFGDRWRPYPWLMSGSSPESRVSVFNHPILNPDSQVNNAPIVIKNMLMAKQPLSIELPTDIDTFKLGETITINPIVNREEITDYILTWTVSQDWMSVYSTTNPTLNYLPPSPGIYEVNCTISNSCNGTSAEGNTQVFVDTEVSTHDLQQDPISAIIPNPTRWSIMLQGDTAKLKSMDIYNQYWQLMLQADPHNEVDVSMLPAGAYFVSLIDTTGKRSTHKLIKI